MNTAVRRGIERRGRTISVTVRGGALVGAAVVSLSVAYIAGWPELLILGCFCAIPPLLGLWFTAWRRPRFTIVRSSTPVVMNAGSAGSARLRITSPSRVRPATLLWSDDIPWSPGLTPWRDLPAMDAGGTVDLFYNFVPARRGVFEIGPLVVRNSDPFGLSRGEFDVGGTHRVVVAPELVDLGESLEELASRSGTARMFQHRALAGDHDIMTRDYRPGDALRRVHWRASAHHGELMVREDEKRSHAEALIVVDTRRANWRDVSRNVNPDRPESENFEWALSMVISLRDYLVRLGIKVSVIETAVQQLADDESTDGFIESLARVRLSYQNGPALRVIDPSHASVGVLVAIVDSPDAEIVAALVEQRANFGVALAFVTGPVSKQLDDALSSAGWAVHRVAHGETVRDAWGMALLEPGAVTENA